MNRLDPYALECLAAIVEEGGFERAAQRLAITQSAVSQRLKALEEQVGTPLVVRTRPLRATAAGRLLLRHVMQWRVLRADLARDLQALTPAVAAHAAHERVAVAVNADSIATWALPALSALVHHGLGIEIITDDQDFTADWLREGRVVACVTTLPAAMKGCAVQALGVMRYVAVATPAFAQSHCPQGIQPHNFSGLPFVAFNRKDDLQADFVAHLCGLTTVRLNQVFVPSTEGQLRAVRDGWGVSVLPQALVAPALAQGDLLDLAPGRHWPVTLYWHTWNLPSVVLQALTQAMVLAASRALHPVADVGALPPTPV